jgi:hypothetical protein
MRNWFTVVFVLLMSAAFGQNDAKVDAVYTLGKIPAPLGVYNHVVQARIINRGTNALSNLPVVLIISGANSYTNTQYINIEVNDTILVSFDAHTCWIPGMNNVTVSVPADDNNVDNSSVYAQEVNSNTFSYADASPASLSLGYGTGEGMLLAKYTVTGSANVSKVKVYISNQPENVGNTVYGVVTRFESIIGQSAPHVITAADLGTYVSFDILNPPAVDEEFFAGLLQTPAVSLAYYPVAYQTEGTPTRPGAFYGSLANGSGLTEVSYIGRFMIQAVVDIGTVSPYGTATTQTNYVLAGWDFSGTDSPVNFAATTYDTSLFSSNLLTRGPGAGTSAGLHGFSTTGFMNDGISTANSDYFQFSISPKQGDTLSLSSIGGYLHGNSSLVNSSGVNSQFAYSLDGINFTLIASPFITDNTLQNFNVNLSGIAALQNITNASTISFRYYASGDAAAAGNWGFSSIKPGSNGLQVSGKVISSNTILTAPVVPTGAAFILSDCNTAALGSIAFSAVGTFCPDNKYLAQLVQIFEPNGGAYRAKNPVIIGSLNSHDNSGTINFTIPPGTADYGLYAIRVISTAPYVAGSFSQGFSISAQYCKSLPDNFFRSKSSGNWNDLNTWESSDGTSWTPATLIPDDQAAMVEIRRGDTVSVSTNIAVTFTVVKGVLKVLNDADNKGVIAVLNPKFPQPISLKIDTSGTLQVVSPRSVYNDAFMYFGGRIRVCGKITIGDGATVVAQGFDQFSTDFSSTMTWFDGAVFEWNSVTPFNTSGTDFFPGVFASPVFRLTKIAADPLGGNDNTTINGLLEANTSVTWAGQGIKIFRDGIKGNAIVTQQGNCGKFMTTSPYEDIPASSSSNAVKKGIIGGSVKINLGNEGYTLTDGVTIPDTARVSISGPALSLANTAVQAGAEISFDPGAIFTIHNGNLSNEGLIKGAGTLEFDGSDASLLFSPGNITCPTLLDDKILTLAANASIDALSLTNNSKLVLDQYNLNMGSAGLLADDHNFIVSNDTGNLIRYVDAGSIVFPVGINSNSYTPVTISNSGVAGNIKARVSHGVQTTVPVTTENIDRTWVIGDTMQAGYNLSLNMQWTAAEEQPGFDRSRCYISHYATCLPTGSCIAFFDAYPESTATGSSAFSITRTGITNTVTAAFIVSSKPLIYHFTGNGNWTDPANWQSGRVAPTVIPAGMEVYIDPISTGECFYNGTITITPGGTLKVIAGKKLKVAGDVIAQ